MRSPFLINHFSIVVERSAKYAGMNNGSLMVYFEAASKNEDTLLKQYFHDLRAKGHPFDANRSDKYSPLSAEDLSNTLRGIDSKSKANAIVDYAPGSELDIFSDLEGEDFCDYPDEDLHNSKNYVQM